MKTVVMKFGGASVATGPGIRRVASLIQHYASQEYRVVAVVSALEKVTDRLSEAADQSRFGNKDHVKTFRREVLDRHVAAAAGAIEDERILDEVKQILISIVDELENVLTGIIYLGELTPRSRDYVLSFGERLSAPILCKTLQDIGVQTRYFTGGEAGIVTDESFGDASPLMKVTEHEVRERLSPLLERGFVPVVAGYIAETQHGVMITLGRGGSDFTATIIGAALGADEVWIWKEVEGLMTADPKIVPSAKMLREISYEEAMEMAVFGTKAIHPRALEPALEDGIPVRIRSISDPGGMGTLITKEKRIKDGGAVKAVTLIKDVALISISGAGMVGTPGIAAKVFDVLGRNNVNILMISQSVSEANISFIISRSLSDKAVNALEIAFLGGGPIEAVAAEDDICVVAAVGAGMKGTPGIASKVFTAVAQEGINVRMIAQGSSELNISFVVKEADGEKAVQAVHAAFGLNEPHAT